MKVQMGRRMLRILEDLEKNSPSTVKNLILRVEGLEELPDRERTKRLYSKYRSSIIRLLEQGHVYWAAPYSITGRGETYIRNCARVLKHAQAVT